MYFIVVVKDNVPFASVCNTTKGTFDFTSFGNVCGTPLTV